MPRRIESRERRLDTDPYAMGKQREGQQAYVEDSIGVL